MSDLDRYLAPPKLQGDPLVAELAEQQRRAASLNIARQGSPEKAARANEIARRMGLPPETVERNLELYEAADRQRRSADLLRRNPAVSVWFGDPRNAAVGADDINLLGRISETLKVVAPDPEDEAPTPDTPATERAAAALRARYGDLRAPQAPKANVKNFFRGIFSDFVQGGKQAAAGLGIAVSDLLGDEEGSRKDMRRFQRAEAEIDSNQPGFSNGLLGRTGAGLYSGASSLAQILPATALSVVTGTPLPVLAYAGGKTALSGYGKYRSRGADPGLAAVGGGAEGTIEAVTELLPMKFLVGAFGKAGAGAFLTGLLAREVPGEQIATFTQDAIDTAIANPDKTWGQFLSERPGAAYETLVASVAQGLLLGGPSEIAGHMARRADAREAARQGNLLTQIGELATESKTRQRDPEAFRRFIEQHTQGTAAENVYISGEALRELYQSEGFEGGEFFDKHSEAIAEAVATGGDVVVPLSEAATSLAGTPAWDALKDDIRLSAGGMSTREAQTFDEAMADEIQKAGEELSARLEQDRAKMAPRDKLAEGVRDKLMLAGFRPDVAASYAEMMASRYATRAARMGQELTGNEADTIDIRQVLPEKLARAIQPVDGLDMVIAALRGKKAASGKASGPSLLEFISKRGGVEDPGGDIASMGGATWHKGKVGKRKLIRPGREGPDMLGDTTGNANTLDALALAAWEAGYFPDMTERPSVDQMLEAIGDELRGKPIHADDRADTTDELRMAAQELQALLDQAGVDAETATPEEIKGAVAQYQAGREDGRALDQPGSAAFQKWFGDSKVVDEDGKPLVVYHGTTGDITQFDESRRGENTQAESAGMGFFFSDHERTAESYANYAATDARVAALLREAEAAEKKQDWAAYDAKVVEYEALDASFADSENRLNGQNVLPVYLSLQNPLIVDAEGENGIGFDIPKAIKDAVKGGHDGVIVRNLDDAAGLSDVPASHYIVFKPTQIKSAIGNRGTFDPNDSRIMHQPVYHGSPHVFDRFSLDHVGKGEGVQAFGWGLYFAGKKDVAAHYRNTLAGPANYSPKERSVAADKVAEYMSDGRSFERARAIAKGYFEDDIKLADEFSAYPGGPEETWEVFRAKAEEGLAGLDSLTEDSFARKEPGRLYEAEIPEDDEYLDWALPFKEQSAKAKAALRALGFGNHPAPPPIKDQQIAAIVRAALKDGAPGDVAMIVDNDYGLYKKAQNLAHRVGIDTDEVSPGEYIAAAAADHLAALEAAQEADTGEAMYRQLSRDMAKRFSEEEQRRSIDPNHRPSDAPPLESNPDKAASLALLKEGVAGIRFPAGTLSMHDDGSYNYVVFDDNAVSIRSYEQSFGDGPRGRITFGNGKSIIDLFEKRDLSTFIHESGHLFLEELKADAESPAAPDQVKADWAEVQKWFAANGVQYESGDIPTEAHELWARGFERFALEGKSPSSALRRAFDAFRSWLLTIYQVVERLRSPVSDEVRGVMQRLLATDEEIADAQTEQNIKALFTSAAEAGMTEAEFAAYQKATTEARDEAYDALLYRTMATLRKARTKEWREEKAGVEAEVTRQVDRQPVFRALRLLTSGLASDAGTQKVKLDRAWLVDSYGADALSLLPKRVPPIYADKGTTHADAVAEMAGFATGDEMIRTLMGMESQTRELRAKDDKRSVRQVQIDERTAEAMMERHGDILNDGSIEDEARALIHNDRQGEVIASEIRALARRANKKPTPYALAREWAAGKIAQSRIAEAISGAALQRYERAARNAAKRAEEAMLAGDVDAVYREKQSQMLNNALVSEARQAKEKVDAAVARLSKLAKRATIKSIDQGHLDQVHGLLEQVEFRTRSQTSIDRQESYEAWATAQQAAGYDIVTPPSFAASLGSTHWSRLSVEQLLGLDDTVKQIVHLGRLKQTLLDNKEKREFDAVVGEAVLGASNLPPNPPSDLMEPSRWDAIKSRIASMDAALLKMETVFDWLDGGNPNGVFNRIVFRRIADAQDREKEMLARVVGELNAHLAAVPKAQVKRWTERVIAPELLNRETGRPWVFTRDQLVSMALNMGNEGNARKLAGGYGWNEAAVMAVLNRELSAADWQYVQKVWDTIEGLWPEIAALEKRLNGVEPEKVEARPLDTPAGPLRGGYFPVVYDPRKSVEAETHGSQSSDSLFENIYSRATTPKGFTKERTKVERPIHLSLGIISRHVAEVIHDITHREAVMDADRFLSDRRVMKAVDDTLGPEIRRQFRPWLQHIANEWAIDRAGNAGFEAFLKKMRVNATVVGLGLRVSTMQMQVAGYSNAAEVVGAAYLSEAIGHATQHPVAAWEFVSSRSPEMRHRMETLDRDIRDSIRRHIGNQNPLTEAQRFFFHGIGYADRIVVVPTWLAAYNKATAEGMDEADAVYAADKVVRQSQGAGNAKDLAAIQRGTGKAGELLKYLTAFYSYMSAFYQRQRTFARDAMDVDPRRPRNMPALMARAWWLFILAPIAAEILAGRGPDDDDDEAAWAAEIVGLQMFGPIPIVRDAAKPALAKVKGEHSFDYQMSPAAKGIQTSINLIGDGARIAKGEETKRATQDALETAGYFTGLVPGQVAAASQFLVNVGAGEEDPDSIGEWWEGLTKGKIKEES